MKGRILIRSFLTGVICPMVVYLAAGALDVITKESNLMFAVMFVMSAVLLALPAYFLYREKKLNEQFPTKLTAPAYLLGYGILVPVMLYVTDSIEMEKLFGHRFLGGIGLTIMLIILACGFCWAVLFRIGAAIVSLIKRDKTYLKKDCDRNEEHSRNIPME